MTNRGGLYQDAMSNSGKVDPVTGKPVAIPQVGSASALGAAPTGQAAGGLNPQAAPEPEAITPVAPQAGSGAAPKRDLLQDGGSPADVVKKSLLENANQSVEQIEQIANRVTKARAGFTEKNDLVGQANLAQITENMKGSGVDMEKARQEFAADAEKGIDGSVAAGITSPEEGSKLKKRLSKVFDIIPEEDMGLFLMEFGMRAMMAGETMGDMAALGAAGSGALSSMQGRHAAAEQKRVDDLKYATEEANKQRELGQTDIQLGMQADRDAVDAAYKKARAASGGGQYQGEKVFLRSILQAQGYPESMIASILTGGATPDERFESALESLREAAKDRTIKFDGRRLAEIPPSELPGIARKMLEDADAELDKYKKNRASELEGEGKPALEDKEAKSGRDYLDEEETAQLGASALSGRYS